VRTRMNGHLLALMMQRHKLASDMRFQLLFNRKRNAKRTYPKI
jgi:hypothetical protein